VHESLYFFLGGIGNVFQVMYCHDADTDTDND